MITYEWCLEYLDENGDIEDHHHADSLAELVPKPEGTDLCLIRYSGNEDEGIVDKWYAYESGGILAANFEEGGQPPVPKKYLAEFARMVTIHGAGNK